MALRFCMGVGWMAANPYLDTHVVLQRRYRRHNSRFIKPQWREKRISGPGTIGLEVRNSCHRGLFNVHLHCYRSEANLPEIELPKKFFPELQIRQTPIHIIVPAKSEKVLYQDGELLLAF